MKRMTVSMLTLMGTLLTPGCALWPAGEKTAPRSIMCPERPAAYLRKFTGLTNVTPENPQGLLYCFTPEALKGQEHYVLDLEHAAGCR